MDHVDLPEELALPWDLAYVQDYLRVVDPDLRIRVSVERSDLFILERRVRRRPMTNLGMKDGSDFHVQMRDGYVHISTVDPSWLHRPWRMVEVLKDIGMDVWDWGGFQKVDNELRYEEQLQKLTRRQRRMSLFRGIAADAHDVLTRLNIGGRRTRFNNPGLAASSA